MLITCPYCSFFCLPLCVYIWSFLFQESCPLKKQVTSERENFPLEGWMNPHPYNFYASFLSSILPLGHHTQCVWLSSQTMWACRWRAFTFFNWLKFNNDLFFLFTNFTQICLTCKQKCIKYIGKEEHFVRTNRLTFQTGW